MVIKGLGELISGETTDGGEGLTRDLPTYRGPGGGGNRAEPCRGGRRGGRVFEEGSCGKRQGDGVVSGWKACGQGRNSLFWMRSLKHPRVFLERSSGERETHDLEGNCRSGVLKWVRWEKPGV